jgi:hypothetical protein
MTASSDPLAAVGTTTASGGTLVTSEELEALWTRLMPDTYAGRRGLDVFLQSVEAGAGRSEAVLEFRPGGWQVDLHRGVAQSVIATALIGGLLVTLGATGIPAAVVTAVVPLFFDVSKVTLTAGQEYLLAELVAHADALDGTLTAPELYERLSPASRSGLSMADFVDFIDVCRRAGLSQTDEAGTIELRPSDQARFRITFV